ncbi:hypothetical protein Q3G72_009573 [Acer saccharum]|nr:hypothetical protein Q3G72_009573 [Acer saccharum]
MGRHNHLLFLLLTCGGGGGDVDAQFTLETFDNQKGIQLVERAKEKMMIGSNSCWHTAYRQIFDAYSKIISDDNEKRKRGATFRCQTERLVNDLKRSTNFTEDKLKDLDKKSEKLLQRSYGILSTLNVIDEQTQQVVESLKKVSDHISVVKEYSEEIFNQFVQIAATQSELQNEQEKMKNKTEEEIATLHDSYNNLGQRMEDLKTETVEVEKKINEVGNAMSNKMSNLQSKANEIKYVVGVPLDKQKQLMDGQSKALEGLQSLTEFRSQAFTKSRDTLKELAEFGHKQQEALIKRQE